MRARPPFAHHYGRALETESKAECGRGGRSGAIGDGPGMQSRMHFLKSIEREKNGLTN